MSNITDFRYNVLSSLKTISTTYEGETDGWIYRITIDADGVGVLRRVKPIEGVETWVHARSRFRVQFYSCSTDMFLNESEYDIAPTDHIAFKHVVEIITQHTLNPIE